VIKTKQRAEAIDLLNSVCYIVFMIKNISTKDLAECLGSTIGFASQIKTGRRKLPPKHCIKVSRKFGIPLHVLRDDIYPAP
jgi:antitoxin component HigA of HigAB toxin-antitoxin module